MSVAAVLCRWFGHRWIYKDGRVRNYDTNGGVTTITGDLITKECQRCGAHGVLYW